MCTLQQALVLVVSVSVVESLDLHHELDCYDAARTMRSLDRKMLAVYVVTYGFGFLQAQNRQRPLP